MNTYSREEKLRFYNERKLNTTNVWLLFIFLGWSYGNMGQIGKQIFFYLTLGGLGLWTIYVLFTLKNKMLRYNLNVAREVGLEQSDIQMLGLSFQKLKPLEEIFATILAFLIIIYFIIIWVYSFFMV